MRLYHYNLQAVRVLLYCVVNLKVENFDGRTALGMLQEQTQENNSEIKDMLSYDGALSCFCQPKVITCYKFCRTKLGKMFRKTVLFFERFGIFREIILVFERIRIFREKIVEGSRISNDDRNALLVVAALLITITYQVVLSPPGGLWQETKLSSNASGDHHLAGTAIAEGTLPHFQTVATINYITFTLSAIMTFLLLPSGYISALFKMALVQLWVSLYYSWGVIILDTWWAWRYCLYGTGLCFVLVLLTYLWRQNKIPVSSLGLLCSLCVYNVEDRNLLES
ncbi:ankyrin repeat-containing protein bda1 [Quercus suber]|uniref:Ankyrin repeat-containing protein bda1 n=1 Tax=Quercus suber TaxID=58331 RepID=A0AAW0M2A0_QUESU